MSEKKKGVTLSDPMLNNGEEINLTEGEAAFDSTKQRVQMVPVAQIDEGVRFRQDYGNSNNWKEFVESVKTLGIITPVTVLDKKLLPEMHGVNNEPLDPDKPWLLIAGGRRLRAAQESGLERIPAGVRDDVTTEKRLRVLELVENLHRLDLSWAERVRMIAEIHDTQVAIKGEKKSNVDPDGHSMRDTATMINAAPATVTKSIKLAEAIKKRPELAEMKTRRDAERFLEEEEMRMLEAELAKRQEKEVSTSESKAKNKIVERYILKAFEEGIKDVPDESVDFVEFDPPYAIDLVENKTGKKGLDIYSEITEEVYEEWIDNALAECYRVMKPDTWGVLWFAPEPWAEFLFRLLLKNGFITNRMWLSWVKGRGQTNNPTYLLASGYELAFYFRKGNAKIVNQRMSNVFAAEPVPPHKKIHPTQRPIALIERIYHTFTKPGDTVLVPCLGSGASILAGVNTKRTAFGFDLPSSAPYRNKFSKWVHAGEVGKFLDYYDDLDTEDE